MGDTKQPDYKLLVDTAVMAGQLMLASGAEVYRVEDTVERILAVSGLKTRQAYVTSTGFIVTLDDPSMDSMTVVRRIPSRDTNLNRIMLVNDISREFCDGRIDLETAFRRLKHLDASQYTRKQMELANIGVASMFAIMFGGTAADVAMTAIVGVLLVLAMRMEKKLKMNAFFSTMISSVVIALGSIFLSNIPGFPVNMDVLIVSAIMPIVPGAAFITAIRDILQGDYVSGGSKVLESLVKAMAIAIGVSVGMMMTGGLR